MSNEIIKSFKAVVDRLASAQLTGGTLAGVTIRQGPLDTVVELRDLPYIQYQLESGGDTAEEQLGGVACQALVLLFNLETRASDGYYNTGYTGGILWLFERLQKALDLNAAGVKDLSGDGNWRYSPKYSIGTPEKTNLGYKLSVTVTIKTKKYLRGSL
jgi:hypothetical protein